MGNTEGMCMRKRPECRNFSCLVFSRYLGLVPEGKRAISAQIKADCMSESWCRREEVQKSVFIDCNRLERT